MLTSLAICLVCSAMNALNRQPKVCDVQQNYVTKSYVSQNHVTFYVGGFSSDDLQLCGPNDYDA